MKDNRQLAPKIALIILLAGGIVGFWYFETVVILKYLAIILGVIAIYQSLFADRSDFISSLTLYFTIYSIYNIYFWIALPLWAGMLGLAVGTIIIFYMNFRASPTTQKLSLLTMLSYLALLTLFLLEIFLLLYFWPISPLNKALLLVAVFYLIWQIIILKFTQKIQTRKIVGQIAFFIIVVLIVIITARWYNMNF